MRKLAILAFLITFLVPPAFAGDTDKEKSEDPKQETPKQKKDVEWFKYDEGLKLAKEKNLHVLVNFTTSWCGWCKRMNKTTFKEPEVVKLMNNSFVSVKVDAESKNELNIDGYKITERNLALTEFGARSYPTYWFLKPDGQKLGQLQGYQQADIFIDVLYFMKENLYDKMTFEEYMKAGGKKGFSKS